MVTVAPCTVPSLFSTQMYTLEVVTQYASSVECRRAVIAVKVSTVAGAAAASLRNVPEAAAPVSRVS